jgi:hypothetical protein
MDMDERTRSRLAILFGLIGTLSAFASISGGLVPLVITIVALLVAIGLLLTVLVDGSRRGSHLDEPEPDPQN